MLRTAIDILLKIFPASLVLPNWRYFAHSFLLPREALPVIFLALCQYTSHVRWLRRYTASFGDQLYLVDISWIHLQLLYSSLPLQVVDAIQLYPISRARRWSCNMFDCHFLLPCLSKRWH